MKFQSMLRTLRNIQQGMGSTARNTYTPYQPYTEPPDDPFEVDAGDPQTVSVGAAVNFNGSVKNAPAGVQLSYSWTFGDGATSAENVNGLMPSCIYTTLGEKTVTLTVSYTDTNGDPVAASDSVIITVIEVVPPPIIVEPSLEVDAGDPQTVSAGERVNFNGSVSNAPDDATLTYSWTFGDGATSAENVNGLMPSCIYTTCGEKTVTLTVSYTDADDEEVKASDDVIITVIEPLMPWCTSELPAEPPAVIQLAPIPPSPPTYAVPVQTGIMPIPTPVLPLQGKRPLNELEKAAIDLVFKCSPSFNDTILANTVRVAVKEELTYPDGARPRATHSGGLITFYRVHWNYTDVIDAGSTVETTDIFKPGNLSYLNSFIHEAAHWWQFHQNRHYRLVDESITMPAKRNEFDYYTLRDVAFIDSEAHASAVATWFIIAWQLEHRPTDQLINLTQKGRNKPEHVGTVNRYSEIAKIDFQPRVQGVSNSPPVGTWITREDAKQLACHFKPLIEEIQTAQPLPRSD